VSDEAYVYATAAVIVAVVLRGVLSKSFDPFAPHWLFLTGFAQVYVVQAITAHEWAIRVRGVELVTAAGARTLWALIWFLVVYYQFPARRLAALLPSPPRAWSVPMVSSLTPWLVVWGLISSGMVLRVDGPESLTAEGMLLRSFPILMLVAGVLLIVTGRNPERPRPAYTAAGLGVVALYIVIWTFHGKRSPPLFGVLATLCAYYSSGRTRPSKPVLAAAAAAGVLVVSLAIGFRGNPRYEHNLSGFLEYIGEFDVGSVLVNMNVKSQYEDEFDVSPEKASHETEEYGGFLLMLDTVPGRSEYDHGASYIRIFSTYIPRILWRDKPFFGREQWVSAWIAGSEFKRDRDFTGPAVGILGATQLNGGAVATVIVLGVIGALIRTAYEYFRLYESVPWVQVWWSLTFFNAWLMTVNDDPAVWFYYVYGHTTVPPLALLWFTNHHASKRIGLGGTPA
jgi:hypothetical protein